MDSKSVYRSCFGLGVMLRVRLVVYIWNEEIETHRTKMDTQQKMETNVFHRAKS